ncbi:hypothetical protein [Mangrovibacterium lignilyticum]|nr:hypothetical protein [Mangrovibacterium lignilyticum]
MAESLVGQLPEQEQNVLERWSYESEESQEWFRWISAASFIEQNLNI